MFGFALKVLCFASSVFVAVNGYNLDTKFPIVYHSNPGNYFGFTVALHRNRDGPVALVGAPRANSSMKPRELHEPGVLYKCNIENNNKCQEVVLDVNRDTRSHNVNPNFDYHEKKDGMWLGVSLDVQQNSVRNDIVTCGHKWINQLYAKNYFPSGACYVINGDLNTKQVSKLVPFVDKLQLITYDNGNKVYNYGFGQVGSSAAFSEDGKYLMLGAPGYYHWTGTVVSYASNPEKTSQVYEKPSIPGPPPEQNIPRDSYIGYSVTSGKFYEDGVDYVAAGAPRDGELLGRVYISKAVKSSPKRLVIHSKKEGSQLGEYFGASVLGMNLNGDSYTDLLVGAPLYSSGSGVDEGKVYVYLSSGMGLHFYTELHGTSTSNARFGSAIANVGDLNQDGYNDVAIGAPYEDGSGVVYIYHGSHNGIRLKYVQRISAIEIDSTLSGFGIHISRGIDIDNNLYPDVLVGAYTSSNAVLFRTHPVIQLSANITFSPRQININVTNCYYQGKDVPCVNVTVCLQYTGNHVPSHLDFQHEIVVEPTSQVNRVSPRGFFLHDGKLNSKIFQKSKLDKGSNYCFIQQLYIQPDIKDVITPVQLLYKYSLVGSKETMNEFNKSLPVIDSASPDNVTYSVSFQTGCGTDDTCHSDLSVTVTVLENADNKPLIIGERSTLSLVIEVVNKGEPAYLSELLIYLPSELPSINQDICSSITNEHSQRKNASLVCELGNPLLKDQKVKIQIKLDLTKIPTDKEQVSIAFEALTGSTEIYPEDNSKLLPLHFKAFADISITGSPLHEQIPYDSKTEGKVPAFITHSYFVMNHGPSPVQIIDIMLQVPTTFEGTNGGEFITFTSLEVDSGTIPAMCNDTYLQIKPVSPDVKKNRDIIIDDNFIAQDNDSKTVAGLDYGIDKFDFSDESSISVRNKRSNVRKSTRRKDLVINCDTAKCKAIQCSASPFSDTKKFAKITVSVQVNLSLINEFLDPWYRIEFVTSGEVLIRKDKSGVISKHHHPDQTTALPAVFVATFECIGWLIREVVSTIIFFYREFFLTNSLKASKCIFQTAAVLSFASTGIFLFYHTNLLSCPFYGLHGSWRPGGPINAGHITFDSDQEGVKTTIVSSALPPTEEIAQWIIFLSIGIGILLLLIILALLIKFGFFKREQMEKMEKMKSKGDLKDYEPINAIEVEGTESEPLN